MHELIIHVVDVELLSIVCSLSCFELEGGDGLLAIVILRERNRQIENERLREERGKREREGDRWAEKEALSEMHTMTRSLTS